ncbi:SET and MYND domain-containing protein DDB_G0273589-like [Aphidius gifuensis]|nr:SET and MYND domain-containing protein DDB_G0273589-like [Aphidius gifuensis]
MTLGDYGFALNDLNLAANETLPSNLRTQLENTRQNCYELIRKSTVTVPYKHMENKNSYSKPIPPELTGGPCESMAGLSNLVEVQQTANAGVHAVAAGKINVGDILAVEAPFVSCLLPEYYGTHCQNCFVRLRAPIGCPNCSLVAFCGEACRDSGTKTYHKYECKILTLLIGSGMSILSILALRMVTERGLDYCKKMYEKFENTDNLSNNDKKDETEKSMSESMKHRIRKKNLNESVTANEHDTSNILNQIIEYDSTPYNLVTHDSSRSAFDFFERTLMAAFLLRCLQTVDFFNGSSSVKDTLSNENLAVAVVLLRNLQLLQFNAHEISETRISNEHRFQKSKVVYIGVALYINCARFNHDCYPAVTRYFTGRDIVICATRPLNPGETVAENYGPIFTKRSLKDRQQSLEGRYWFKCSCLACIEDWPSFDNLINYKTRFRCTTRDCPGLLEALENSKHLVKCMVCKKKINLKHQFRNLHNCIAKYSRGFALMEEEKPIEAGRELKTALEEFHKIACPPHRETHLAEIALAACMADSGNLWKL